MPQTPPEVILLIVRTLALCTVLYVTVLAACVLFGITPPTEVMREFSTAGIFLSGYFCGMLSKTSSSPEPATTSQTVVTKTTSEPPPEPDSK